MSLGLKRGKFGDILIKDEGVQFIVAKEIADYTRLHFHTVGKTKISLEEKPLTEIIVLEEQWKEATVTVSSLRLDAVLSQVFGVSRQNAQSLIENGLVKVNWKVIEQAHLECKEGDVLSARGLGRLKMIAIDGKTKKRSMAHSSWNAKIIESLQGFTEICRMIIKRNYADGGGIRAFNAIRYS